MSELRVVPEDLQVSAATVGVHADTVRARHVAADGQIEGAQRGMPAGAAVALDAAVTKWQTDSAALVSRLLDDSAGLRAGAAAYVTSDEESATAVASVSDQIRPEDMGL
ncbi:hypothetical protein [Mycolicibacterium sp. P9-22]|uniref:hypothetical protein n=1 Tax=Mycolicibacterium sp. P9-22 TaxID=2024613 RepID=UPI0011EC1C20|nr:hypothetical protein [Mycolicibacterium sp. P9-22]KAA0115983.1 hypothetical protein CIW51_15565 [Mycolicibacterium sp. P9-22]